MKSSEADKKTIIGLQQELTNAVFDYQKKYGVATVQWKITVNFIDNGDLK